MLLPLPVRVPQETRTVHSATAKCKPLGGGGPCLSGETLLTAQGDPELGVLKRISIENSHCVLYENETFEKNTRIGILCKKEENKKK